MHFVQYVAKRNVKTVFLFSFSVRTTALHKHNPPCLFTYHIPINVI